MDITLDSGFHLSQNLLPHSAAVRALAVGGSHLITGSIDKTCKIYKKKDGKYELQNEVNLFTDYILSLVVRRNNQGFIVGCKDKSIYLLDLEGNPHLQLEGHQGPVNSLSESPSGKLISGAWDGTAIVWDLASGKELYKLEGHSHAVAVLALDHDIFVTGSQDKNINIWEGNKKIRTLSNAHQDIIRELAKVGEIGFLSCSNDESIKFWSQDGELINTFVGHEAFIFSVSTLEDGRFISGSDDRALKVWKDDNVQQSIGHPSTIWTVRADHDGDLISACADGYTRVFSSDPSKVASADERNELERQSELAASQGPDGLSEAELAKIPSVDALNKTKGKKDGEVRLFKNGRNPEAFVWKEAQGIWEKIGDVVGNKTSQWYDGDKYFPEGEYEYIFDVDDESGVPKRLPFNSEDNPLQSAEKFLMREGLGKSYLEQITSFIRKNTRPTASKKVAQSKQLQSKFFPYNQLIFFETGNFDGLSKKLFEFNESLKDTPHYLKEHEQMRLVKLISTLKEVGNYHLTDLYDPEIDIMTTRLIRWPLDKLLPVLDLFRVFLLHHKSEKLFSGLDNGLQYLTLFCQVLRSAPSDVLVTLVLKNLANMTKHTSNKNSLMKYTDMLLEALESQNIQCKEKDSVRAALAAFVFNISASVNNQNTREMALEKLLEFIVKALSFEKYEDNVLKYFVSYGNILSNYSNSQNLASGVGVKESIERINSTNTQIKECQADLLRYLS